MSGGEMVWLCCFEMFGLNPEMQGSLGCFWLTDSVTGVKKAKKKKEKAESFIYLEGVGV